MTKFTDKLRELKAFGNFKDVGDRAIFEKALDVVLVDKEKPASSAGKISLRKIKR